MWRPIALLQVDNIWAALLGGVLIATAAGGLLLFNGRIAGISNILAGLLPPHRGETLWRLSFLCGLLAGGAVLLFSYPLAFDADAPQSLPVSVTAGFLVGLGAAISNGCTSGHGVCGLARRSKRSLAATATFMTTGALTVYVVRHVVGDPFR